ncbi:MAG: bifunctional nicotinamidase/pyrazinamidase [Pirellulales bacterium]|nr:bifunctional nicotinamidase/pyrazinamidase [Pirellulales bacterium]
MKALVLVDIQNDFLPGGALVVRQGDEVVPVANRLMRAFELVVATKDWHPADHLSFASQHPGRRVGDAIDLEGLPQVLWPDHCVADTPGAELAAGLDRTRIHRVFEKGTDRTVDSYSGFFDNGRRRATGLDAYLRERGVDEVFVMGLATDYCVKFTVLDAVGLDLATHVVLDGCRGVELRPGDVERAVEEMLAAGASVVQSAAAGGTL